MLKKLNSYYIAILISIQSFWGRLKRMACWFRTKHSWNTIHTCFKPQELKYGIHNINLNIQNAKLIWESWANTYILVQLQTPILHLFEAFSGLKSMYAQFCFNTTVIYYGWMNHFKSLLEISKSPSLYTKCEIIVCNTLRSENVNIMKEYLTN